MRHTFSPFLVFLVATACGEEQPGALNHADPTALQRIEVAPAWRNVDGRGASFFLEGEPRTTDEQSQLLSAAQQIFEFSRSFGLQKAQHLVKPLLADPRAESWSYEDSGVRYEG